MCVRSSSPLICLGLLRGELCLPEHLSATLSAATCILLPDVSEHMSELLGSGKAEVCR